MRISNIRSGRMCRLALVCLVILPLLYLLTTWSDSHKRVQEVYQAKFGMGRRHYQRLENRPKEVPLLIEGKWFGLDFVFFFS